MAESETKKKEIKKEPGADLIKSWNTVVVLLKKLETAWDYHRKTYERLQGEISMMHPVNQQILFRAIQKVKFEFFLEDISREVLFGLDNIMLKEDL